MEFGYWDLGFDKTCLTFRKTKYRRMPLIKTTTRVKTVMGLDPGFARTGWAVLKGTSQKIQEIYYGCVETSAEKSFEQRLVDIDKQFLTLIKKFRPQEVAIEQIYFCKNVKTALKVGQVRGILLLEAMKNKIPCQEPTPLQVKQAVTGYGRAEKSQIQKMVAAILGLREIPKSDDAADALAIAIYCLSLKRSF